MKTNMVKGLVAFGAVIVLGILAWIYWGQSHNLTAGCAPIPSVSGVKDVCIFPVTASWKTCNVDVEPVYLTLAAAEKVRWRVNPNVSTLVTVTFQNNPLNAPDTGIPVNPPGQNNTGPVGAKSTATAGTYKYAIFYGLVGSTANPCVDPNVILR